VTPEATRDIIEKDLPGLPELMRSRGSAMTPRAALSRAVAGSCGPCLIVNLPGSPAGSVESLECVLDIIPHALEMLHGGGHEGHVHESKEISHDHT
jgi:molybdopterin biosynthesis enzyme MoaB